jgi:hypothetical protein
MGFWKECQRTTVESCWKDEEHEGEKDLQYKHASKKPPYKSPQRILRIKKKRENA